MAGNAVGGKLVAGSLALTVHGPSGVIDLMVPTEALAIDIAEEYAAQCRLPGPPMLHTRRGSALDPQRSLAEAGLTSGEVLVASGAIPAGLAAAAVLPLRDPTVHPVPVAWFVAATALAVIAGWLASQTTGTHQDLAVALLGAAALIGVVPAGPWTAYRISSAPAFAGAAVFAIQWSPVPALLPTVLGAAALAAALTAAVARALDRQADEALRVWIGVGVGVFVVTGLIALVGWGPQVVWSLLLLSAMLAARLVPVAAVDVPDHYLLDLDRLAVTAWSAREQPTGRRGRTVVPVDAVSHVAARGTRLLTAACAATWALVALAAPLLLATATLPIDRIGARAQVVLTGAALLLAARSYRHTAARTLLRGAGMTCWVAALVVLLQPDSVWRSAIATTAVIVLGFLLVLGAVATGRGWRSAWWSRRAEVAEGLAGSAALASAVVAVGLFRALWELTFRV